MQWDFGVLGCLCTCVGCIMAAEGRVSYACGGTGALLYVILCYYYLS